jgi:ketosteroid isomerase-like protein
MSIEKNIQTVKDFFAAIGRGDRKALLVLVADEFVARGDRVLVIGFARGKIKATNKTFEDDWIFAITVRDGRLTNIREYVDTQALAQASQIDAFGPA